MQVTDAVIEAPATSLCAAEFDLAEPGTGEGRIRMRPLAIGRSALHAAETGEGPPFPAALAEHRSPRPLLTYPSDSTWT